MNSRRRPAARAAHNKRPHRRLAPRHCLWASAGLRRPRWSKSPKPHPQHRLREKEACEGCEAWTCDLLTRLEAVKFRITHQSDQRRLRLRDRASQALVGLAADLGRGGIADPRSVVPHVSDPWRTMLSIPLTACHFLATHGLLLSVVS